MQPTLVDLNHYDTRRLKNRRFIRDMPSAEQPAHRLDNSGPTAVSTAELLAVLLGAKDGLDLATDLLIAVGSLGDLTRKTKQELAEIPGIGEKRALGLIALCELSRRMFYNPNLDSPPKVTAPGDAAQLLMADMMYLEKEHLRVILLNTRNQVLGIPTIYIGSLNASVVRIGEIFQAAIRANAAAIIVAHNHPSGDPSPSPEDVTTTRQLVQAGKLLDIPVLDHVVIGRNQYVSLKERGLGFAD